MWIHDVSPIAVSLGNYHLTWYWLFYPLSFTLVFTFSYLYLIKNRSYLSKQSFIDLSVLIWIGILIGGRLGYFIFYQPKLILEEPTILLHIQLGGMSFHGALLGVIASLFLFFKLKKESPMPYIDIIAVFSPIALFLGRLGNFINGELWGRMTNQQWGILFPKADGLLRHPSQLYQAALEGPILFAILLFIAKKNPATMVLSSCFLIFYGALRFISEFFREPDPQLGYIFNVVTVGFTMGQILCFSMIIAGLILLRRSIYKSVD